jgi:hypothetical protein
MIEASEKITALKTRIKSALERNAPESVGTLSLSVEKIADT